MATSSVNFVSALGAGSGIDTKSLAENLVEAERAPRKEAIDTKIKKEEARITGHGAIKSLLTTLQQALAKVNETSDFSSITSSNSQPTAFGVTASTSAQAGSYDVEVTQIAKATRLGTAALASTTTAINTANSSAAFDLSFNFSGSTQTVSVTTATPAGMVNAVNASTATTGVSAQLVKTSSGYTVVFTGPQGSAGDFTISGMPADVNMRTNPLQTAQDAELTVNGLPITSSSNQISETIPGVTLNLYAATSSGTPARLDLSRQTTGIKENISALVKAYNDFDDGLKVLGDSASDVADFGGALAGDSLLQTVRSQIRSMLVKDSKISDTATDGTSSDLNPDVYAMRHIGLGFDRNGKMTLDQSKLDSALGNHFDQVVTMLTANQNNQSIYSPSEGGLAGNAVKNIDKMLRSTGIIDRQTSSAETKIIQYKKELTALEDRMTALLDRYTKQFSVMDSIVGESNSTKTSLTNSFKGLMAMYTNN